MYVFHKIQHTCKSKYNMPANPWAAPIYSVSCQEYIKGDWLRFDVAYDIPELIIQETTYR